MGSYLCVLRAEGRAEVRYPVEIGRLRHWDGVAPGEHTPTSVWLPPAHLLGPDEVYVPAGWFRAGGDPEIPESGVETRLWVDAFVMDRDPVTNIAYLEYLNDLVAQGRTEEALLHAPRERSGVVARAGPLVYGFEDGRFFLVPDGEGDMWAPDWPVLQVDWHGARAFLEWRAARTGRPWRQPAAAEREKAARGVDGRWHPWGDAFDPSWCCMSDGHRGRRMPAPVGAHAFDESTYGVRGLAGNVADWCVDPVDAPRMPNGARLVLPEPSATDGAHRDDRPRVFHGGAWSAYARGSRAAHRNRAGASVRLQYLGLRGVWSMDALRGG
jgi:serine/threonine-protein kinase